MNNTFYIGDTHFNHANILKFEPTFRPFSSIEEHNEFLIDRWNSVVKKGDIVWHLGDLLFGKTTINTQILARLNGRKKLIMGNHDDFSNEYLIQNIFPYFERVLGVGQSRGFVLTHIPVEGTQFFRWKGNIHGHTHSRNLEDPRYVNVSCEQIGLTPISYEELHEKYFNAMITYNNEKDLWATPAPNHHEPRKQYD